MTRFAYKAVDALGRRQRGGMEALGLGDLEQRLRRLGLDLITAWPARAALLPAGGEHIPLRERIQFCFQLEQLVRAGVPLVDALADLGEAAPDPALRRLLTALVDAIEGGRSLSEALAAHRRNFDPVFCALVRAGETAGTLPDVLRELSQSLRREDELRAFTRKLVIYPAFVLLTTFAAVFVALVYVVPELAKLFRSLGQPLPLQTRLLVGLSAFVVAAWPLLVGAATGLPALWALLIRRSARLALHWDAWRLRLPLFGPVYRKIVLARFAGLFAMMYGCGIPILDILRVARDVLGNRVLRGGLERVERLIAEGQGLSAAFLSVGLFPPLVLRMLHLGEQTGSLDQALRNVGYFYERDVRESIERLQAAMEPLIILVLGGVMLWVALAILGPVYDLLTHMKV